MVFSMLKRLFAFPATPPAPATATPADPLASLIASASLEGGVTFTPSEAAITKASDGRLTAELSAAEAGQPVARLSNGSPEAGSWAQTGGFSIQVPDEFEAAASGNKITVTALVRALDAAAAGFALTYSTNEVGNAGWQQFTATAEWAAYRFDYSVPPMVGGWGDFIGVLPAPAGHAGIEVALVTARVLAGE